MTQVRPIASIEGNSPSSVEATEGFAVYDAIVDRIDWNDPTPWRTLL